MPENDSHGEFLFLAAEYFRFTRDTATLEALWPRIVRTVAAIDALRRLRLTPEYETPEKRAFRGLLPESISHEGYSDKPVHSYWDDAFARKGLADAVELAVALGHPDEARSFAAIRDAFESDLLASIALTIERNHLDYVPASVEKHDFDPTSTTAILSPCGLQEQLPQAELARTFDRYVREARERRDGTRDERRLHAVRAADGRRAREARPEGRGARDARVLPEGPAARRVEPVGRGRRPRSARTPLHRGHAAYLGRDATSSARSSTSSRSSAKAGTRARHRSSSGRDSRRSGCARREAPVWRAFGRSTGRSTFPSRHRPREVRARIAGVRIPPGGLALAWPMSGVPRVATVNGKPAGIRGGEILVREVPAEVVARP